MRLKQMGRVRYTPNPLVEVIGQVRFPRVLEMDDQLPSDFQKAVQSDYPLFEIQEEMISVIVGQGPNKIFNEDAPKQTTYHFFSADKVWRISLNREFIALTCTQYERWEDFLPKMIMAVEAVAGQYPITHSTRIGLRYQDLIVREEINLNGVAWEELISPFLLGPTIPGNLAEDVEFPESDVIGAQSYVGLRLEECLLNLRYGLVQKEQSGEQAFMIDADFFRDEITEFNHDDIEQHFNKFHANSGAVFRGCIQQRLHEALNPEIIT